MLLDAFESDYVEDPFLLITAELLGLSTDDSNEVVVGLKDKAKKVGLSLVPLLARATVRGLTIAATGVDFGMAIDSIADAAAEGLGEGAEELIDREISTRIEELKKRQETLKQFRGSLEKLLAQQAKPLVFIIDELDRCKPTFSVHLLERIKHFFAVPNLVFVLLINKEQLERSVCGVYGPVDARNYLKKFINLILRLPTRGALDGSRETNLERYSKSPIGQFGYSNHQGVGEFVQVLSRFAIFFGLTLRDMERAFGYFGIAGKVHSSAGLVGYLCALKLAHDDIYLGLTAGNREAHQLAAELLEKMALRAEFSHESYLPLLIAGHRAVFISNKDMNDNDKAELSKFRGVFMPMQHFPDVASVFAFWGARLDLKVNL